MQRFESLLLTPATKRSGLRQLLIFYALPQQASLSQNAQWRSQKPFKPCAEFYNLLVLGYLI
jgi:hypothetical protein